MEDDCFCEAGGSVSKDGISWIRLTPEYTRSGDNLYQVASRMPEYLNRAPGRTFEYGYSADPDYYAGITVSVKNDYEFEKFKATFWVDSQLNEYGEYQESEPVIEFKNENGNLLKQINAEFGKLYDVELDIKDVETLEIWVRGSLSIIGEPQLGK